jgi:hypothetical protein
MVGVNPFVGTNYLDTVSAFIEGFLHLLAGEGVWGRGRHLSPFPLSLARMLSGANAVRISGYKLKPGDRMHNVTCPAAGEITIRQPQVAPFPSHP